MAAYGRVSRWPVGEPCARTAVVIVLLPVFDQITVSVTSMLLRVALE